MKRQRQIEYDRHKYAKMSAEEKKQKKQAIVLASKRRKQFSNLAIACLPSSSHSTGHFLTTV
ncbi:hypothetical protein M5K25_025974 [Dendrobium thyrsiflorum]|uniref:Ribosomal protein S14 n=1 Tax=Dendrobium thyrsiflorum TaxID=117978 RepID=A0ABD0TW15_DENTH